MQVLQVQLEIRPDPAEVGRARRWARSRLAGSGIDADEPIAETLILIVSELVTNAVVHTGCPAVLRILLRGTDDTPSGSGDSRPVARAATAAAGAGAGTGASGGLGAAVRWGYLPCPWGDGVRQKGFREAGFAEGGCPEPDCAGTGCPETEPSVPDEQYGTDPGTEPGLVVGSVRVEVADASARPPRPRQVDGDETGGRGLALVDGLADRWGWEPSGAGKRIWCELDRGTPGSGPPRTAYGDHAAYESLAAYEAV